MEYYYDYETSSSSGGTLGGILGLALFIWIIVCIWRIFKKAGRKGRESLIPIRNLYVLFKISGHKKWFRCPFIIYLTWMIVSMVFRLIGTAGIGGELLITIKAVCNRILGLCAFILPLIATILLSLGLAKKFNKHRLFGLGLLFLGPIFYGILAFDESKYNG